VNLPPLTATDNWWDIRGEERTFRLDERRLSHEPKKKGGGDRMALDYDVSLITKSVFSFGGLTKKRDAGRGN